LTSSGILRRFLVVLAAFGLVFSLAFCGLYAVLPDYRDVAAAKRQESGASVVDRNGAVLSVFPDSRGQFSLWIELAAAPETVRQAFIAAEDRRFFHHFGFDPIAIVRALYCNFKRGRTVSGASTITQQVARMIRPRPRTWRSKIIEISESVKMEVQLSKNEILELYINLAPMGGNIRGIRLAAWVYFGKAVEHLNAAEAALLAGLPRSPGLAAKRAGPGPRLKSERDRVLKRMAGLGLLDADELQAMLTLPLQIQKRPFPLEAPHLMDLLRGSSAGRGPVVNTTLDIELQRAVEKILRSHQARLARLGVRQASALVASVGDGEALAMVGSLGYETTNQGFNNAIVASRGAGSTLKPFLYALALEKGSHAFSEVPDTIRSYATPQGDYLPLNADRRSYGPVSIRTALGNSLNLSAVKMLESVGAEDFHRFLKRLRIVDDSTPAADHYGLGLAIGNMEVSLFRLVQAYAVLAREGVLIPLTAVKSPVRKAEAVMSKEAAYIISEILADPTARLLTFGNPNYFDFGFPVSVKTGTSNNFRDAWIIGYTGGHVIGVWAGNFDGRPANDALGANVCGPILKEILAHLYSAGAAARRQKPDGVSSERICWMSGKPASSNCRYTFQDLVIKSRAQADTCGLTHGPDHSFYVGAPYAQWVHRREMEQGPGRFRLENAENGPGAPLHSLGRVRTPKVVILNPHDRDRFVAAHRPDGRVYLRAQTDPPAEHVIWFVNGVEIARTPPPYEFFWQPLKGGHEILAVTPDNYAAKVRIWVE
jgi:penicillin-binding protein 1C